MSDLLVMVRIAGRLCALRAHQVQSVIDLGAVTPVPRAPAFVRGIAALRSQTLTVIDCRRAIGLDPAADRSGEEAADTGAQDNRAVVVLVDGHSYALDVDRIEDVATGSDSVSQVPGGFGPKWSRAATGMIETGAGPALLLDLTALIAGSEANGVAA